MWLNRNFLLATVALIVSIILFSSLVTATTPKNCRTIIKTRDRTKTVYPLNCPKTCTTVTVRSLTTTTSTGFTTTTSITTTTTTITQSPILIPRNKKSVICIPDKSCTINIHRGKCEKTFFCKPTVYLPCPKVRTSTKTAISTITEKTTSTSTFISTSTSFFTCIKNLAGPCTANSDCCNNRCLIEENGIPMNTCF
ncbi:hypothetical protein Glove_1033g21 [Diversispora epigaea]|uniref:WAP domain-containing protein n=1 Tax=Diversispora epigaea TaxID=1348612 RepID=A0A397G1W7_9GLOM|nr:hypothetical protein Glove_1033g21 [Diversispora epigaea]